MAVSEHHEKEILLPRGITAEQAAGFGIRSIETPEELPEEFRNSRYATLPGLLFPWNSPLEGTVLQYRPDEPVTNPQGDPVKYVFPSGTQMVLSRLKDTGDGPLLVQEGTMQSTCAAIYAPDGWSVYGMSGCWSWRKGETQVAIPDLMVVDGRHVVVSLDADAATNLDVYNAGASLKDAMLAEGALSVKFLWLAGVGRKAGLDDVLGTRPVDRRASYLLHRLEAAEDKPAKTRPTKKDRKSSKTFVVSEDRPMIMVNDDRFEVINQMTDALDRKWNGDRLFYYGKVLAWRTGAAMEPVTKGKFANLIAEAARTVTINSKGEPSDGWPDSMSCEAVLDRSDRFSLLERLSRVPFIRADGSICQTPGYDPDSHSYLYLEETGVAAIDVPEQPTDDDVKAAVDLLCGEWLGDLFESMSGEEDRANCLALMLTPFIRGLVPLTPMAVVDGLQPGVGKNLIADLLAIIATGKSASPLPYSREDDENRKVITSAFRAGTELFIFDEAHTLEGRHLAKAITTETYSDRMLGVSSMIEFPNNATWVALGNNVIVNVDLARRVYRIRLAPSMPNPQDRDANTFRHPDIRNWTRQHRSELVTAALTLIRAWFAGRREESAAGRRFGSFERWGGMIGGILDNAGIKGFLGSLVEWRSETDYESRFWSEHMQWLVEAFGEGGEFTANEVVRKMKQSNLVEHPPNLVDHDAKGYSRALGIAYSRVKGRSINGLQLTVAAESSSRGNRWMVLDLRARSAQRFEPVTEEKNQGVEGGGLGVSTPCYVGEKTITYTHTIGDSDFPSGTGVRVYPNPQDPPTMDGADPLASLLPLCIDVPAPQCPDCNADEELVPGSHWYACRSCTPGTFAPRT